MSNIILKAIDINDGLDVFDMIREIGPGENGFENRYYDMPIGFFMEFKKDRINEAKGIGLLPGYVKQSFYVLYVDGKPVGCSKLRHNLTGKLFVKGGHIGYSIAPSERDKGYGKIILKETLEKAKELNINKILINCNEDNIPSRKVIEYNRGVLESIHEGICRFWIELF